VWTTNRLAKAADVNPSSIRRLLAAGKLQGAKLGRDWIIPDDEAQRYLDARRNRGRFSPTKPAP